MTTKQAEYLAGNFDAREYTEAGARTEFARRVKENEQKFLTEEELSELIANYPDFPRDNE